MRARQHWVGNWGPPCSPFLCPIEFTSPLIFPTSRPPHHPGCFPFRPLALRGDGKPTRLIGGLGSQEGLFWKTPNWLRHGSSQSPGPWPLEWVPEERCSCPPGGILPACSPPQVPGLPSWMGHLPWQGAQHRAWPGSAPVNIHSFLLHPQQNMARSPGAWQPLSLATAQVHWSYLLWAMLGSREELRRADDITYQAGEGTPNLR